MKRLVCCVAILAVAALACGGSDEASEGEASAGIAAPVVLPDDAEVFTVDEGAGCSVFVSVRESEVPDDRSQQARLAVTAVVDDSFAGCAFSDVAELALVTVDELDEYNQPDWASMTEHSYFAVGDWAALKAACEADLAASPCTDAVEGLSSSP